MSLEFRKLDVGAVKALLEAGKADMARGVIHEVTNEILRETEYKFEQVLKEALRRKGVDVERKDFPEFLRGRLQAHNMAHENKTVYLLDGNAILERYNDAHFDLQGLKATASINYRFL